MDGKSIWRRLHERDGNRCHYCRLTTERKFDHGDPRKATIDHKTPRSRGGSGDLDNLVVACTRCNSEKSDIPYDMYRWYRHMILRGYSRYELLDAIDDVLAETRQPGLSPRELETQHAAASEEPCSEAVDP